MPIITVVIHTRNEENNIKDCIESARRLTQSIVVIDMESTDKTVSVAHKLGVSIFSFPQSAYVEPARNFGIQKASGEWVFLLDADERVSIELATEIKQTVVSTSYTHFKAPHKNIFAGKKWLTHGGWWPDYQIRLIQKKAFINWPQTIHSPPQIEGKMGFLKHAFIHYFHPSLENMVEKTALYENIEADLLYTAGRQVKTATFFRKFFGELFRRLIQKMGVLDGVYGVIESLYQSYSKTITWLLVYEKKIKPTSK